MARSGGGGSGKGRLLLIDDEPLVLRAYGRALQQAGFDVQPIADSDLVPELLERGGLEAIFCDVSMPGLDGPDVLRAARARDPDLPVVLMSGGAIAADVTGALRCLRKPMDVDLLKRTAKEAIALRRLALLGREAHARLGRDATDAPLAPQAIVSLAARKVVGLSWAPGAAARPGMVVAALQPEELGEVELPDGPQVFVALDERKAMAAGPSLRPRLARLMAAGRQPALDGLGAGPGGLGVLIELEPRLIRLHPALVRGVDGDDARRELLAALAELCQELDVPLVAPGIGSAGERDALVAAGVELGQSSDPQLLV